MSPLKHLLARARMSTSNPGVRAAATVGGTAVATLSLGTLIAHNVISYGGSAGPSMYPTIPAKLTTNVWSQRHKHGKNIKLGDIVVLKSPIFPDEEACKRVIGMPGDYVLRDPYLSPTVGGAPVPGRRETDANTVREEPMMVQVPEGHVWVAGDNMSWSRDSRFYGPVPKALIIGKTLYVGDGWFDWTSFRKPQLQGPIVLEEKSHGPMEQEAALEAPQPG